ncbi:hypothetical protein C8R44DRAFT_258680 [Mycena epipterygia]|nr:hypothetical protein C8R44DRAFT_258680 [Mycena epipterygia]
MIPLSSILFESLLGRLLCASSLSDTSDFSQGTSSTRRSTRFCTACATACTAGPHASSTRCMPLPPCRRRIPRPSPSLQRHPYRSTTSTPGTTCTTRTPLSRSTAPKLHTSTTRPRSRRRSHRSRRPRSTTRSRSSRTCSMRRRGCTSTRCGRATQ